MCSACSRAKGTRAPERRRIVQVTQDHSAIEICGELVFLAQPGVVEVSGTNGKGMKGAVRRIQEESAALEGTDHARGEPYHQGTAGPG